MDTNKIKIHKQYAEPWKVTLIDTGEITQTGGRLNRVRVFIDETFCFTYGDGLANVNIASLLEQRRQSDLKTTLTAVQPLGRYGSVEVNSNRVVRFQEKPAGDGGWINGGFFVLEPSVFELLNGDICVWENLPFNLLAHDKQLGAYFHHGFWLAIDTLRDRQRLEELWATGKAPWKVWD
jgi:glucose-1-phosphate cytidylyltransferase